ncbi:hypothetical protein FisN_31Lh038 [Fistulifera solaris]|uniref:Uncharacterized protein n=1 Tax=Fistulifera solaris TaxID=1519565 RepID=A0A1Z5K667_FISSO|nr:hypothetical protein FisN_31Lh038 [Fistulifera solaris]|eukprot:GAX21750.1 hypothetical protein FisN_31Lh038 [Fistulifera solaris]
MPEETSQLIDTTRRQNHPPRLLCVWQLLAALALFALLAKLENEGKLESIVPMEGVSHHNNEKRNKKKTKQHAKETKKDDKKIEPIHWACEKGTYSERTLQLAYELPFIALFPDTLGQTKFEASSVVIHDDYAYAVCDSSWSLSKFRTDLQPFSPDNVQIVSTKVHSSKKQDNSGYEALVQDAGFFYVVRESIQQRDKSFHAEIEQLQVNDQQYSAVNKQMTEFEFEGDSKGFEGAIAIHDQNDGALVILALCEANHCSEERKDDVGNGKLVAMKSNGTVWTTLRIIDVPPSAAFHDYSAISILGDRVAITSQEESQVWIGRLKGLVEDGLWDIDTIEFASDEETVYDFPKDNECETIYCNIEGIHWMNEYTLLAVSDKMKGRGKQDFRCFDKDQTAHVFVLP